MLRLEIFFSKNKVFFFAALTVLFFIAVILTGWLFYLKYQKNETNRIQLEEEISLLKEKLNSQSKEGYGIGIEGGVGSGLQPTDSPNSISVPMNTQPINMNNGMSPASNGGSFGPSEPTMDGSSASQASATATEAGSSPTESPKTKIEETNALKVETWKTYENKKYKYSFKYPSEFNIGECSTETEPCKLGKIVESDGGNTVDMSSSFDGQTWPRITLTHLESEEYNLPADKKLIDWVKEKFPAVATEMPKSYNINIKSKNGGSEKGLKVKIKDSVGSPSPDSNNTEQENYHYEVFVEKGSKIFKINLQGINGQTAKDFYDDWLDEIKI